MGVKLSCMSLRSLKSIETYINNFMSLFLYDLESASSKKQLT